MERLTVRHDHGITMADGYDFSIDPDDFDLVQKILAKLADYEDTGMEPCDHAAAKHALEQAEMARKELMEMISIIGGVELDRLKELVKADKEGRLVVLPCKVGDTVYVLPIGLGLEGDFITEAEVLSFSSGDALFRVKYKSGQLDRYTWNSIGKTVFLTREEAEAALLKEGAE